MNIYPAIDLMSGECVRLYQGCYDKKTVYENNPINLAKAFAEQGASVLHIVDLDGAKQGESVNLDLIGLIFRHKPLEDCFEKVFFDHPQIILIHNVDEPQTVAGMAPPANPSLAQG